MCARPLARERLVTAAGEMIEKLMVTMFVAAAGRDGKTLALNHHKRVVS